MTVWGRPSGTGRHGDFEGRDRPPNWGEMPDGRASEWWRHGLSELELERPIPHGVAGVVRARCSGRVGIAAKLGIG